MKKKFNSDLVKHYKKIMKFFTTTDMHRPPTYSFSLSATFSLGLASSFFFSCFFSLGGGAPAGTQSFPVAALYEA